MSMFYLVWHDLDGVHVKEYKANEQELFLGQYTEITERGKDAVIDLVVHGTKLQLEGVAKRAAFQIKNLDKVLPSPKETPA